MSWSPEQAISFAKRIAKSRQGQAWWAWPREIRDAIVSEFVLDIVLAQDKSTIQTSDITNLRQMICAALSLKHNMKVYVDEDMGDAKEES